MLVFVAILLPLTSPCQTSGSFCQPRLTPLCPHCWPSVSPLSPLLPLFFLLSLFPLSHVFLLWLPLLLFFQLILYLSFLYILICFPLQSSPQFPFFTTSYFFFFCFVLLSLSWCTLIIFYQLHVTLSKRDLSLTSSCCLCCLTI